MQVLSVALCLSAASALPQQLVHAVHTPTFLTHAAPAPAVVRTVAHPAAVLAHPAAPAVITHAAAPTVISHAALPAATTTVVRSNPAPVVRSNPAPVVKVEEEIIEEDAPAHYQFGYSVADELSGDSKTLSETRDGDFVEGSYTIADPDGRIRVVTYTADKENGFQATVTYDGEEGPVAIPFDAPEPAPAVVAKAAPLPAVAPLPAATHTVVRTAQPAFGFHSFPVAHAVAPATTTHILN